jgi:tetratricopeptide (TPR) repeat protein
MGRYEEVLADFDRAIELDPDNVALLQGREKTYKQMGRHQ